MAPLVLEKSGIRSAGDKSTPLTFSNVSTPLHSYEVGETFCAKIFNHGAALGDFCDCGCFLTAPYLVLH